MVENEHARLITMYVVLRNISSRFSSNSEALTSELLENLEEMLICYR